MNWPILSALTHQLAITLAQIAAAGKTNGIGAVHDLLVGWVTQGRVFTADALLTQRDIAQLVLDGQSDYVFIVKKNQPTLYEDIAYLFSAPLQANLVTDVFETMNEGHGRIERR
jgi:predicted transposase YbfD/YdcC